MTVIPEIAIENEKRTSEAIETGLGDTRSVRFIIISHIPIIAFAFTPITEDCHQKCLTDH